MNSRASTPGMGTEGDDNEDETMLAGLHGMKDKLNAAELAALKAIVRRPQRPKQLRPVSSAACTQRWLLADRLGIFRDPPEVKASYHVSSSAPIRVIRARQRPHPNIHELDHREHHDRTHEFRNSAYKNELASCSDTAFADCQLISGERPAAHGPARPLSPPQTTCRGSVGPAPRPLYLLLHIQCSS